MISTLFSKDIFKDASGKLRRYSYETILTMRLLMVILKVGEKTSNSCWIQGTGNQALCFVDDILQKTEDLCVKNGLDPTIIESNLNYILHMSGGLAIRREYGKRTVSIGYRGSVTKDHSEIDDIFKTFDMAGLKKRIHDDYHGNMCTIVGYIYKSLLTHCADAGIWNENDDLAFNEIILDRLSLFHDHHRYVEPVSEVLDNIFL